MLLQLRRGYAADFPHGLLAGMNKPASESSGGPEVRCPPTMSARFEVGK
ncbi:MAG: hypothetical protein QOH66_1764 [Actinomycetota bacterium]|jgi:hypothetical protein|nr:hypothetical protein [Actinomycetota bacterium]